VPKVVAALRWANSVLESARHTRNIFVLDHDKIPEELQGLKDQRKQRIEDMNEIDRRGLTDEEKKLFSNVVDTRAIYLPYEEEFIRLVQANRLAEAKELLIDKARPTQLAYLAQVYKFVDYQVLLVGKERGEATVAYNAARIMILGGTRGHRCACSTRTE
jgi:hypothetical protein